MKNQKELIKEYSVGRYKVPTPIFVAITLVSMLVLIFFGKDILFWHDGLLGIGFFYSTLTFAYRHGHEEGYMEALSDVE